MVHLDVEGEETEQPPSMRGEGAPSPLSRGGGSRLFKCRLKTVYPLLFFLSVAVMCLWAAPRLLEWQAKGGSALERHYRRAGGRCQPKRHLLMLGDSNIRWLYHLTAHILTDQDYQDGRYGHHNFSQRLGEDLLIEFYWLPLAMNISAFPSTVTDVIAGTGAWHLKTTPQVESFDGLIAEWFGNFSRMVDAAKKRPNVVYVSALAAQREPMPEYKRAWLTNDRLTAFNDRAKKFVDKAGYTWIDSFSASLQAGPSATKDGVHYTEPSPWERNGVYYPLATKILHLLQLPCEASHS